MLVVGVTSAHQEQTMSSFTIESGAFDDGARLPQQYTCEGKDLSPPLAWTDPPAGTQSLALIMDDPDAPMGTWVHWVLYNIPADTRMLPEGLPGDPKLAIGALQGLNDFGRPGYGGPCPPPGPSHRYLFKLYALDTRLPLVPKSTKAQLEQAMNGHILAKAQLIGRYQR